MRTIIKPLALLILAIITLPGRAQTVNVCAGSSTGITATNTLGLTSPSYSMNPGGVTSSNPVFTVSPGSTTSYTLYTTGTNSNSIVQTVSNYVTVQVNALPITSVSPVNQTLGCGPGLVATATCVALNPSSNVTHNWYSPMAQVLSSNGTISTHAMTPVNGGSTTYTCVVSDNLTGCSTSKTVQVISISGPYPSFSLTSLSNFSLGCSTASVADINIVGANTNPPPGGGVVSYTLLAPGYTFTNYATSVVAPSYTVNAPGVYTVIVRDNGNLCESRMPVFIGQTTTGPSVLFSALTRTLTCTTPSVLLQGSSNTPNLTYTWKKNTLPMIITNSVLPVATTTAGASVPSATVVDNYTLTVTDNSNLCSTNTIITIYQNTRPPLPNIAMSFTALTCQITTVNATNNSTTGVLPGTFYSSLGLVALLWEGPSPQLPLTNNSTYLCYTPGMYSMTVQDLDNGCTAMDTQYLFGTGQAAFTHTINGAAVSFNNMSTGSGVGVNYFWDFGDGIYSTQQNPTHTYLNGGPYFVKFKIAGPSPFCADSVIQSINISGVPCLANSNFSMVPTATAQVWNAIPDFPWNVVAANWNWGDGASSNTLYTSHQYSAAAMYNICLSVTLSCGGLTSTTCASYSIYRSTEASQVIAINVVRPGLSTGLVNTENSEALSWSVAPNPNSGFFNLSINMASAGPLRVMITDLTGRIVYDTDQTSESTILSVDAGDLPMGMYFVTLQTERQKVTKRIVVNR